MTNQNAPQSKPARTLPVKIVRGYWPLDGGEKIVAGSKVELPIDEAKSLIRNGVAERDDALPG